MQRIDIFLEMAQEYLAVIGPGGNFKRLSNSWEKATGYSIEELRDKNYIHFLHQDDQTGAQKAFSSLEEGYEASVHLVHSFRKKDNNFIQLSLNVRKEGDNIYIAASEYGRKQIKDINTRHQQQLKVFVRHNPVSLVMLDKEMRFIAASAKYLESMNLDWQLIKGKTLYEVLGEGTEPRRPMHQEMLNGKPVHKEELHITKDGKEIFIELEAKLWHHIDGSIGGIMCMMNDISEQKIAEREIREKSKILSTISRTVPVVIFKFNHEGIITESSGKALQVLGMKDNQLNGMNVFESCPDKKQELEKVLKGQSVSFTSNPVRAKGNTFETFLIPMKEEDSFLGLSLDITTLKKAEKQIQKEKEKAEAISASKTRFLANMSHEIRTPLNAILGFAQVLSEQNQDHNQDEYIRHIQSSGKTLLKLINDVLDLSKIESGKVEINNEPFNLKESLCSSLLPYKSLANEKGLHFHLQFDQFLPEYVLGDFEKINQVLINLISNSLKFTHKGEVNVSVTAKEKYSSESTTVIRFSVSDTGIGIDDNQQQSIFESFIQADPSILRKYGGTGLGLSICKQIVHLLGGEINIISPANNDSDSDPGTNIVFSLPLKIYDKTPYASAQIEKAIPKQDLPLKLKVLVAEDNELNQKLTEVMLRNLGCKASFATNGEEALRLMKKHSFDVALMDVQMPVMDGYVATIKIKEMFADFPVIGVSANAFREDRLKALKIGMDGYLPKPFTESQLYNALTGVKRSLSEKDPGRGTTLERLTKGNKNLAEQILSRFTAQKELIHKAKTAASFADLEIISACMHDLKSSAKAFKKNKVLSLVLRIEEGSKSGLPAEHLEKWLNELEEEFIKAEQELRSEVSAL